MTWKGWEDFVPPIKNAPQPPPRNLGAGHYDERVVTGEKPAKRGKYGAVKTEVDGITFDSKKEAARYQALKLREQAGEIRQLALQVPYLLCVGNHRGEAIGKYVADFVYQERIGQDWCTRVEDVKGYRTPLYRWKAKHFTAEYGITILET